MVTTSSPKGPKRANEMEWSMVRIEKLLIELREYENMEDRPDDVDLLEGRPAPPKGES